jgi:uncharacterized protein YneF (UPF0154 family)
MTMVVVVLVALVAGAFGGVMASAFMEAYMQRKEHNRITEYSEAPVTNYYTDGRSAG